MMPAVDRIVLTVEHIGLDSGCRWYAA